MKYLKRIKDPASLSKGYHGTSLGDKIQVLFCTPCSIGKYFLNFLKGPAKVRTYIRVCGSIVGLGLQCLVYSGIGVHQGEMYGSKGTSEGDG